MPKPTTDQSTFDTKDIPLVAYLIVKKIHLISAWQGEDSMGNACTYFSFDNSDDVINHKQMYYDGQATVDPREFWNTAKQVRKWARIYANGEGKSEAGYIPLKDFYKDL